MLPDDSRRSVHRDVKIKQSRVQGMIAGSPDNYKAIVLGYDFEAVGNHSSSLSLAPAPARLCPPCSLSSGGHGGRAARSILQLIYVPIVSVHWVTKYPGTGPRTLTAVVTACNDRRYQQFHRIRPRVVCVCMGARLRRAA